MAAIMEQQQGVSQDRRRAEKTVFRCLNLLLLLLCFINYIGSAFAGNTLQHVTVKKGDNATLLYKYEEKNISRIVLWSRSKKIIDCQIEECKSENRLVFKEGSFYIIIKDVGFSDAGKYILKVYYTNDQIEVEAQTLEYHLHIHDEISVKTGEQLKMDVLLINADKVEKNSSGERTEVWTRGHGVSSDRLTDRDGNLTISNFTVTDTGTYRVLDSEGEILITITVTGSSSGSKGKLDTDEDKPDDTEERTVASRIIVVSVSAVLLVLVISALIWIYRRQHRNTDQKLYQDVPVQDMNI